jgi:hypothetical protein
MKKIAILAVVLVLLTATSAFSLGLGLAFGLDPVGNLPSNVMFSAKFDQLPFLMGLAFSFQEPFRFGFTADWWMVHEPLVGIVNVYVGPGLYAGVTGELIDFGLRIPIGFNLYPIDVLELFLEIAPAIAFLPTFPNVGIQAAFGFRFWFN